MSTGASSRYSLAGRLPVEEQSAAGGSRSNQLRGQVTYGNDNRRGWNYGFSAFYDYRLGVMQFAQSQVTYNRDCCGFSVQYRRFNFGTRDENQFRVAFAVSKSAAWER